jgi:hypothetical protein
MLSSLIMAGFSEVLVHLWPLLALLLTAAGFGLWIARPFTRDRDHSSLLSVTLAIPLGTIALAILFLVFVAFSRLWPAALPVGAWIILLFGFALLLVWVGKYCHELIREIKWLPLIAGVIAFLLLLLLRLAFLRDLLAPPYTDSAYHYLLTTRLLDPSIPLNALIPGSYYHLGFHVLSAWLAGLTGTDLLALLPLTGQVLLDVLLLSVYALTLNLTEKRNAARVSAVTATLLWSMPAFAANWGKYPAIAGIVLLPAVCAVIFLLCSQERLKVRLSLAAAVLLIGVTWIHSRVFVLLVCAAAAALVTALLLKRSSTLLMRIFAGLTLIACSILYFSTPDLHAIYNGKQLLPIIGVLILLPFALFVQPRITSAIGIFTLLMLLLGPIPLPAWLRLPAQSLLDRQFLAMSLFLSLSLLIGIGASELLHLVRQRWLKAFLSLILLIWIIFSAFNTNAYTPDPCCNFVKSSDLAALEWIKAKLPPGSTVYIAAIEKEDGLIAADAGVWVAPLTGFSAQLLPFNYAWFSSQYHLAICPLTPAYLYAGNQPYSFQINAITRPNWYELIYEHPSISIYRLIPCDP